MLAVSSASSAYAAITLNNAVAMAFTRIEYNGSSNGNISLGTNGNITYTGGYQGDGTGVAGQLRINDSSGITVDVTCSDTATISDGSNTFTIQNLEIVVGSANRVATGLANDCQGLGTGAVGHTLNNTAANDTIYIGGQIDGGSGVSAEGTYNTSNSGGVPISIRVVVQ